MENLPPLKTILFCGEVMPNKQLNRWRKAYHSAVFANLYGPAEATDACTYYIVNREFSDDEPLPIGRAFNNTDILILTEDNKAADAGQVGELCIRGASLASGYYNNPEKTAAVFVQNPLNDCYPDIIYRSGDMVRVNEYDEIMFVSRKDFQVKVQGHRIELGEIETAASSIDDVDVAACIFDAEKGRTVLFYSGESTEQAVKLQLKTMLSDYMQPRSIIKLDVMPKNINGKIDRLQLKEILAEGDNGGKTL